MAFKAKPKSSASNDESEREHICELCHQHFWGKELMDSHYMWHQLHDLEQQQQKFGVADQQKSRNVQHLIPRKRKFLVCPFCLKQYLSRGWFNTHLRQHTGNSRRDQSPSLAGNRNAQKK